MSTSGSFIFKSKRVPFNEIGVETNSLSEFEAKVLVFAGEWLSKKEEFIVQTSGSTGSPKPIILTRKQIAASAQLTKDFFNLKEGQSAFLCLDPGFIAGKMMIVRALEVGMNLICVSPSANPLEKFHIDSTVSVAALVPYQLEAILNSSESLAQLNKIEKVIVGGARVPTHILEKIQSLPTQFFETYGMTETITHVAVRKLQPVEIFFNALPGITFSIDERSCLAIQANHLGITPIITNDVVDLVSTTSFKLIGRADNIINSAGIKVAPESIEEKIEDINTPLLKDYSFFISGMKDRTFGEKVILVIESNTLNDKEKSKILSELKSHLEKWEVPKEVIAIPHFLKTESGKINRAETNLIVSQRIKS